MRLQGEVGVPPPGGSPPVPVVPPGDGRVRIGSALCLQRQIPLRPASRHLLQATLDASIIGYKLGRATAVAVSVCIRSARRLYCPVLGKFLLIQ